MRGKHTHRGSQCEWIVRGERRRAMWLMDEGERERRKRGPGSGWRLKEHKWVLGDSAEPILGVYWWLCQCESQTCGWIWEQKSPQPSVYICLCAYLYVIWSRQVLWMNVTSLRVCLAHVLYGWIRANCVLFHYKTDISGYELERVLIGKLI